MRLVAVVSGAATCRVSSRALSFEAAKACTNGRASVSVRVPKNKGKTSRVFAFRLTVAGSGRVMTRDADVTEFAPGAPRVTAQPHSHSAALGAPATFTAAAAGKPSPHAQWQVLTAPGGAWRDVAGATSWSYSLTAESTDNGYEYRAVFNNEGGAATTRSARLTVTSGLSQITPPPAESSPVITLQPASQSVPVGGTVTLTAAASGDPTPSMQWQISTDGVSTLGDVPASPSTTYSFTASLSENGYEYRAVFTNTVGSATTVAAVLTVAPAGSAPAITVQPTSQGVPAGETATFSATASGYPTPTVQWQLSTDEGSSWAVIAGATADSYSLTTTASETGYEYRAVFTNSQGSADTAAAVLTVSPAPVAPSITTQPVIQSVIAGSKVTFDAAASGNPTPTVQWQISDDSGASWSDISGATSPSYTMTAGIGQAGDGFRAVFTNMAGTVATAMAILTVEIDESDNWSGYFATGDTFTAVAGSWTVPSVDCSSGVSGDASEWVGIDGVTSDTVEQDGTAASCNGNSPSYVAWYEMYGDPAVDDGYQVSLPSASYPVAPGDAMTASVVLHGSTWDLSIANATAGWTFEEAIPSPTPAPSQSSAEWIVERPEVDGALAVLTDFASVTFTDATATGDSAAGPITSFSWAPVAMEGSTTLAQPGPLTADGEGFTDTWYAGS